MGGTGMVICCMELVGLFWINWHLSCGPDFVVQNTFNTYMGVYSISRVGHQEQNEYSPFLEAAFLLNLYMSWQDAQIVKARHTSRDGGAHIS